VSARAAWLALGLMTCGGDAWALVRTRNSNDIGIYWNRTPVVLQVDAPLVIPSMAPAAALAAVQMAADRWSQGGNPCTSFVLAVTPREGRNTEAFVDGENRLVIRADTWCNPRKTVPCYDPSILALTTVTSRRSDGMILDADIELNATNITWRDVVGDGASTAVGHDLEAALTHELGHLAGYDHTCVPAGEEPRNDDDGHPVPACDLADPAAQISVMYPFESVALDPRRTLTLEDRRDHCHAYPRLPDTVNGEGSMGCAFAPAARHQRGTLFAAVVALVAARFARRRRR
jgi:hypothetical protein